MLGKTNLVLALSTPVWLYNYKLYSQLHWRGSIIGKHGDEQ